MHFTNTLNVSALLIYMVVNFKARKRCVRFPRISHQQTKKCACTYKSLFYCTFSPFFFFLQPRKHFFSSFDHAFFLSNKILQYFFLVKFAIFFLFYAVFLFNLRLYVPFNYFSPIMQFEAIRYNKIYLL